VTPFLIYAAIFISSTALTFTSPAGQAFMPALVPKQDYMNAVNINSIGYRAALVVGPALAGFIIAAWGVTTAIFCNVLFILYFAGVIYGVGSFPQKLLRPVGRLHSIKEGIAFVRGNRLIWSAMILDFIATFFASGMTLMPVFAQTILKVGPQGLGILYASPSIGGLIGGFLFSAKKKVKKQGYILIVSVLLYGVMTVLFGLSTHYTFSVFCMALVGAADMVSSVIRSTLRQMVTPDHLRGRMVSINMMFYQGGPQLGEVESGVLANYIGTPYTVVVGGVATVVATILFAIQIPELMNYQSEI
jgi:MFS family permease